MITIPEEYEGKGQNFVGFHYKLIDRNEAVALYEITRELYGKTYHSYEVVIIQFKKARTRKFPDGTTKVYEAGEYLPTTSDWGKYGFSWDFLDHAKVNFKKLSTQERINTAKIWKLEHDKADQKLK